MSVWKGRHARSCDEHPRGMSDLLLQAGGVWQMVGCARLSFNAVIQRTVGFPLHSRTCLCVLCASLASTHTCHHNQCGRCVVLSCSTDLLSFSPLTGIQQGPRLTTSRSSSTLCPSAPFAPQRSVDPPTGHFLISWVSRRNDFSIVTAGSNQRPLCGLLRTYASNSPAVARRQLPSASSFLAL